MKMYIEAEELIPGLPNDLARECLIRIPYTHLNPTRSVNKCWNREIGSKHFHRIRKLRKISRTIILFAQADPASASSGPARKYYSSSVSMNYRLTAFDTSTATWRSLPPIPGLPRGLPMFCQLAAVGSEVAVVGGWDPVTWSLVDRVYIYSFATGKWRKGAGMPGPKRSFFACAGSGHELGGVVFVAGGHDEVNNLLRSAMMYDLKTDRWAQLPDMGIARIQSKGIYVNGSFHVIGGLTMKGQFCKFAETFDTDAWIWGMVEASAGVCTKTCVAGEDGKLYVDRDGHVAVLDGDTWRNVCAVPRDADVATMMVTWQGNMMVVGSGNHGGRLEGYVIELGNMMWRKMELPFEFSGHVQAACCLEI